MASNWISESRKLRGRKAVYFSFLIGSATIALGAAHAENIAFNGTGNYTLSRGSLIAGGPRTVDILTDGAISLNLGAVTVANSTGIVGAGIAASTRGGDPFAGAGPSYGGPVTITSGTLTATGSGASYGIDARTDVATIHITSGSTSSQTNPGSRGIYAVSDAGDIIISADTTFGTQTGIYTEALPNNPSSTIGLGNVTITSNLARANGVGAAKVGIGPDDFISVHAILGQGRRVSVTSADAQLSNPAGLSGSAIFVKAMDTAIVKATSTTAVGNNVAGIRISSLGTASVESNAIVTEGLQNRAIVVNASGAIDIKSANIVAAGALSIGISAFTNNIGNGPVTIESGSITADGNGIVVSGGNGAITVTSTGTIGSQSTDSGAGIIVTSNGGTATIASNVIENKGSGIQVTTKTGNTRITSGTIVSSGSGITVQHNESTGGLVDVVSGKITADGGNVGPSGPTAAAIYLAGTAVTLKSGDIAGTGSAIGVTASTTASIESGSIAMNVTRSTGGGKFDPQGLSVLNGVGIYLSQTGSTGNAAIKSESIVFTGTGNSTGITALQSYSSTGTLLIDSRDVKVVGNGGYGIRAFSPNAVTVNSTGTVSTVGTTRMDGIGMIGQLNGIPTYADGIAALTDTGALTITNSGLVTTAGAMARGIVAEAGRLPDDSAPIILFVLPSATIGAGPISITNSGSVSTMGDGSTGIRVRTALGLSTINSTGSVQTTGAGAVGIDVVGGKKIDIVAGTVTTTGVISNGIKAQTFTDAAPISIQAGTIIASGADSFGIQALANRGALSVNATKVAAANGTALSLSGTTVSLAAKNISGRNGIALVSGSDATLNLDTVTATAGVGVAIDAAGIASVNVASGGNIAGSTVAITSSGRTNLDNSGTIGGASGVAVRLSAADDIVTLRTGSVVNGAIVGNGGVDKAVLNGSGTGSVAAFSGFESLRVAAGAWIGGTTASTFNSVTIDNGATLQLATSPTGGPTGVVASNYVANGMLTLTSTAGSSVSTLGNATVSGAGTVRIGSGSSTLDGVNSINTANGIVVADSGSLLLTGTQGGKVDILAGGTFAIGDGGTSGLFTGDIVDNGTLIVNHSDDYDFTGALTGSGDLVKKGNGVLSFGAGYAFTGTTTVEGGSIRFVEGGSSSARLIVSNNAMLDLTGNATANIDLQQAKLTVNQPVSATFTGSITGEGTLTKTGDGTLNLTGDSSYKGLTTVTGGKLAVNGSIVSPVTVSGGGKLGGTGRVGNVTIGAGGAYAPGNSIGTQNVAGNVVFASGSTYEVETNADGRSDRIIATGTANIATGTTVAVLAEAGNYSRLTSYNILSATGGVTGTFTNVISNFAFLTPSLSYSGTAVTLRLLRNDVSFASLARTPNQLAVANAIAAQGFSGSVFNAAIMLSNAATPNAYSELSGELFAAVPSVLIDQSRRIRGSVLDRAEAQGEGWGIWGQAGRAGIETDATGNVAATATDRTTVLSGVDYGMGQWRVGFHAGYIDSNVGVKGRASQADVHTKLVGAYGRWSQDALTVKIGGDYSWHDVDTTRSVSIPGLNGQQRSGYDATSQQLFGEVSYTLIDGPVTAAPFGGLAYVRTHADRAVETGTAAALTVASRTRNIKLATAGWHLGGSAPIGSNATLLPHLTASAQYAWGDLRGGSVSQFGGAGQAFGVSGARLAQATYGLDGGVDVQFGKNVKAGIGGFMSTSKDWSDFGGNVSVSFAF